MHGPRARSSDGWLLSAAALVLYLLLAQHTTNYDGATFLWQSHLGNLKEPHHVLYLPMLWVVKSALMPMGLSLYQSAILLSALGSALGVRFTHGAARTLDMHRAPAALLTGLVATCPCVVDFATKVETHGPFFGFAALSFWAMAWTATRVSSPAAAILGVATGLASAAHATGNLLPGIWLPLLLVLGHQRGAAFGHLMGVCAVAAACHAAFVALAHLLLQDFGMRSDQSFNVLVKWTNLTLQNPGGFPQMVWQEWLVPYLPLSLIWVVGFALRRQRLLAGAFLVGLLGYLFASFCLGGNFNVYQLGAYMLPLAPAAALLAARWLRPAVLLVLVAGSLPFAGYYVKSQDDATWPAEYVAGVRELNQKKPLMLVIGDWNEMVALFKHDYLEFEWVWIYSYVDTADAHFAATMMMVDGVFQTVQQDHDVIVTDGCVHALNRLEFFRPGATVGKKMRAHFLETYVTERVTSRGLGGYRLLRKKE